MQVYFSGFSSQDDVVSQFSINPEQLQGMEILFAYYSYEDYSGEALVILRDQSGTLYEVNGSHCSCYGLEGQWDLEETTIEALNKRNTEFFNDVVKAFISKHLMERELVGVETSRPSERKKM